MKKFFRLLIYVLLTVNLTVKGATVAPTNLISTNVSNTTITVIWTVPTNTSVIGYTVRYSTSSTFANSVYKWNGGPNNLKSYVIAGLTPNTVYYIQVKSEGTTNTNDSPFSTTTAVTTTGSTTTGNTSIITGLTCTTSGTSSIQLSWISTSNSNTIGFTARFSPNSSFTSNTIYQWLGAGANNTTGTITGLTPNTLYYIQIKAEGTSDIYDSPFTNSTSCTTLGTTTSALPQFDHIVIYILENHGYTQIVNNLQAPNFNSLISGTKSALMTQSYALTHPSQPNYLMMFSGSNQGRTDNTCPSGPWTSGNIYQQLGTIGKTYSSYSQNLPSIGSLTCSNNGYGRKHCPWTNWSNVDRTKEFPITDFPISNFSSLPYLSFVIPDNNHNWHNNSLASTDAYINTSGIMAYASWAKANNSLLIITFDEDDGGQNNNIATVFVGAYVNKGTYSQYINHYSILRMLEDMNGLPRLGGAANASQIDFCWSQTPLRLSGPTSDVVYKQTPLKVVYYGLTGNLLDPAILPKNQIIIKTTIYSDSLSSEKIILN